MKIRVFTDGACSGNPGPGGWAVVWNTDTDSEQYAGGEQVTTNNRMELLAMAKALELIAKTGHKLNTYDIFSDSAYVVNGINKGWIANWKRARWKTKTKEDVKNRDLWEQIDKCLGEIKLKKITVDIHKVKGHAGNCFNELADQLARAESKKRQQ